MRRVILAPYKFFSTVVSYILSNFPITDEVLKNAEFAEFNYLGHMFISDSQICCLTHLLLISPFCSGKSLHHAQLQIAIQTLECHPYPLTDSVELFREPKEC